MFKQYKKHPLLILRDLVIFASSFALCYKATFIFGFLFMGSYAAVLIPVGLSLVAAFGVVVLVNALFVMFLSEKDLIDKYK